ncbi:hypothetical protein H2248_001686 [Termitomyces sp. 'cryptogamus']|nr:hypothetical protein H2248_001686 [Termitomyces sp. 'cryptogamus']
MSISVTNIIKTIQAVLVSVKIKFTKKGKTGTEQEKSKDISAVEDTVDVEVEKVVNGKSIKSMIKVEAKWVEEVAYIEVDIGKFLELAEEALEYNVDIGKFFKLVEKALEIEVDVGEFFELVEKVEAKARSSAEKHKDHTEEAEVSKEKAVGKVESTIASCHDVGKAAEIAEQAIVVEGVIGNVVKVASEVKHAEEKIEETTHKEVVEQVLSKEEVKAIIKANKNGVLVEIVKHKIEVIAEIEKKATRKCHMQCRKQE